MTKRQNWTIILLFLALVFGFTAVSLFKGDTSFSEKENRVLAQMPDLNMSDIFGGKFATDYETYLSDQFFARDQWIGVKTRAERAVGKQEINDIYFAEDGYLIEKHTGTFATSTAEQNIGYLAEFLEAQQQALGKDHVKAIVVPNAVEILKDKLPPFAVSKEEGDYLSRLAEAMPKGSLVDAQGILSSHTGEELYYRTDHHWKTRAARYVYEGWAESINLDILPLSAYRMEVLTEDFLGTIEAKVSCQVESDSIEAYFPLEEVKYSLIFNHNEEEVKTSLYDETYLEGRDKYGVFFGGNQPLIEAATEAKGGRRLLVIKDSYANCFLPFALQDFEQVDIVDLRYLNESLKDYMGTKDYTDILVLYNASGFAGDTSIVKLAS